MGVAVGVVAVNFGHPPARCARVPLRGAKGLCSKSPVIMRLLEQQGILFQKSTEIVVADRTKRRPSSCGTGRNNWELLTKVTKPSIQSRLTQSHLIEFLQIGHDGSVSPSRRSISTK